MVQQEPILTDRGQLGRQEALVIRVLGGTKRRYAGLGDRSSWPSRTRSRPAR